MIKRRDFVLGASALAATPVLAQTPAAPPASQPPAAPAAPATLAPPAPGLVRVALNTAAGTIVLDLNQEKAPITTKNFLRYIDAKRYDASSFYRASRPAGATTDQYGIIQGGNENNPAKTYPAIALEPTTTTGLKHLDGTISMGRSAPNSATSDFFICIGDAAYLDSDPSKPGDNLGYAAFGQVVQGMDVVKKILVMPTSPTKGVGAMKGQMLEPRVAITTARRV